MGQGQLELEIEDSYEGRFSERDELGRLLADFSRSLTDYDKFIFYLWVIQTKLNRKVPTKENLGVWFEPLNAARQTPEFRNCYELFKKVYDFIQENYPNDKFFTKSQVDKFEGMWNYIKEV